MFDNAGTIINDAATELGLSAVADPVASADPNFVKLEAMLKSAGRRAVGRRAWSFLRKEASIVTVGGQEAYALPADYVNLLPDTMWDRSTRFPAGTLSPFEWQYLKAISAGNIYKLFVRFTQNQLLVYGGASVPAGHNVFFEYKSLFWAGLQGSTLPGGNTKEFPTRSDDLVFFDPQFMVKALKHEFALNSGLGDVFKDDMDDAFELAANKDSSMGKLSLAKRRSDDLIGGRNLPPTGFGS